MAIFLSVLFKTAWALDDNSAFTDIPLKQVEPVDYQLEPIITPSGNVVSFIPQPLPQETAAVSSVQYTPPEVERQYMIGAAMIISGVGELLYLKYSSAFRFSRQV